MSNEDIKKEEGMDIEENKEEDKLEEEASEKISDKESSKEDVENDEEAIDDNIDKLKEELDEINNRYLRLQADFTNYKRRNEKERVGLVSIGKETIVTDILPVIDNFDRAMDVDESIKENPFYEGIAMIKDQLLDVLKKHGLEEIDCLHKEFDPNYHYAVQMEESETYQANVVLNVMQKGYLLNDKVIRPAMVIVSK